MLESIKEEDDLEDMKQIGIGRTAEVYRVGDGKAVKLFNQGISPAQVNYEAAISEKVAAVCLRAPKFFGLAHFEERNGLQYELIAGETLALETARHPFRMIRFARELGKVHQEIHSINLPGLRSVVEVYVEKIRQYLPLNVNMRNELIEFLENGQGETLCHGDFHPENVLVDQDGYLRVIDWVNAYCGNPLSDVARTYYLLRKGVSPVKKRFLIRLTEFFIKPFVARIYLQSYFSNGPLPKKEFSVWQLIIHIARYKNCIKKEQLYLEKAIRQGLIQHQGFA